MRRCWRWQVLRLIVLGYSLFLAIEFVALHFVGRGDSVPQPTWPELARAWLGEAVMAPRVFCWRQPFRWRLVPDELGDEDAQRGRRGAVFIHGFVCNRGFWNPWLERLRACGHPFIAVNLEPVFGSIEDYAPIIEDAVRRLTQATGLPPVLICHSMGGLAARAWLRAKSADVACAPRHYHRLAASRHLARSVQPSGERAPDAACATRGCKELAAAQWPMPRHRIHLLVLQLRQHRVSRIDRHVGGGRQPADSRRCARGPGLPPRRDGRVARVVTASGLT